MKMRYYKDTDSLYIDLSEKPSVESLEVAPGIVVDFDEKNNIVGIDIDRASQILNLSELGIIGKKGNKESGLLSDQPEISLFQTFKRNDRINFGSLNKGAMKQLIQNYKTGEIRLEEVSPPICNSGGVLVRNISSVVSLGTERSIVELGKRSLIGKARERPDLFKQALNKAKRDGSWKTFQEAMGRLDTPNPLGYSCVDVADDLLRVRFGMNLPEPDSFVVVACPDTEIGFFGEG
jgi:uncharacterized protein YuzE